MSVAARRIRKHYFLANFEFTLMALPALLILLVFNYLPMAGIVIAFKRFRANLGFFGSPWVGFQNFSFFFKSQDAWRITRNTMAYNAVFIILGLVISVAFALMLFELTSRAVLKLYQTVFFFPYFLSWVVVGYVLYAFLNMQYGLLNGLLHALGAQQVQWYIRPGYWPFILVLMNLWKSVGYFSVIYYAGLMGIDKELFEACVIDGANKWQTITRISVPLLSPLIIALLILQIGRIFYADFGLFYNLPRDIGTLYPTTDVIDTYVFRSLRVTGEIGMSSAANFYQALVGFTLVVVSNGVVRRISPDHALF
ncbi:MAG: ABC transporter permease subunit [Spirochaetia bacterium]|jgi:putative aldouronate transport system permease protein